MGVEARLRRTGRVRRSARSACWRRISALFRKRRWRHRHARCKHPVPAPNGVSEAGGVNAVRAGSGLSETALKNVALEAVRTGNFWAEPERQSEVHAYIADVFAGLLKDTNWLRKQSHKLQAENGLTERYTVQEILTKTHETDGFDIFVDADEACAKAAALAAGPRAGPVELEPGAFAELSDNFAAVVAAAELSGDPVGPDEVAEIIERCAVVGETVAAVFCAEHIEAIHNGEFPEALASIVFNSLKPLLRPGARQAQPRLIVPAVGPLHGEGRAKSLNARLSRVLDKLACARRQQAIAAGGSAAEHEARATRGQQSLKLLCAALLPLLLEDKVAAVCSRRGPLLSAVTRLCHNQGLHVSYSLSWDILQELERTGAVRFSGRKMELVGGTDERPPADVSSDHALGVSVEALELLESLARERLDRRKRRRSEKARTAKRRRTIE